MDLFDWITQLEPFFRHFPPPLYILAGAFVGFIIGLTGVGGGSLMTPILILFFRIPPSVAVGTDLIYATLTKSSGIYFHHRQRTICWPVVLSRCLGSIPAAIITVSYLSHLKAAGADYEKLMLVALGTMLMFTALTIFGRNFINRFLGRDDPPLKFSWKSHFLNFLVGIFIGILVTLSSVGAGVIGTAIVFLLFAHLPAVVVVGTELANAVPLTAVAGIGHWYFLGDVDLQLLSGLVLGGLPAVYLGSRIGKRLPDAYLRPIIAAVLFVMGFRLVGGFEWLTIIGAALQQLVSEVKEWLS